MNSKIFCILFSAWILAGFYARSAIAQIPPAPKSSELSSDYILELRDSLGSEDFTERTFATKELMSGGVEVIRVLSSSLNGMDHESSIRVFEVFRKIYLRSMKLSLDKETEEIEERLYWIAKNESSSLANLISSFFEEIESYVCSNLIQRDAIRRLILEGVEFRPFFAKTANKKNDSFSNGRQFRTTKHFDIVISKQWSGNHEAMRLFRRIHMLKEFPQKTKVYLLPTAELTAENLRILKSNLPFCSIQLRGPAVLGVKRGKKHITAQNCAEVQSVFVKSPAGRAGIKSGDRITRLGNPKICSFESFDKTMARFVPGQTVLVSLDRYCPVVEKLGNGKSRTRFQLNEIEIKVMLDRK